MSKSKVIKSMTKKEALKVAMVNSTLDMIQGKLAKVTFIKVDGSLSTMSCRIEAKVDLKGKESTANKEGGQITVYKMAGKKSGYRSFYGQNVTAIECGKLSAKFE